MLKEQVAIALYGKLGWNELQEQMRDYYRCRADNEIIGPFKAEVDKLTVIDTIKIHDKTGIDITNSSDWERIKRILEAQLQDTKKQLLDLMGE